MRCRFHFVWALAAWVVIGGLAVSGAHAQSLKFTACEIGDPATRLTLRAECSEFEVAENPDDPAAGSINLHIARLAARSSDIRPDPLTILAGGPGQAASESFPSVQTAFEAIRKNRDIYLIDQRGTGLSNRLECPDAESAGAQTLKFNAANVESDSANCLSLLSADTRYYTTSVAVNDLDRIRRALGLEQWNVYGISYGTRVGLHYLRKYPDSIRTLILDAVVPPDIPLGANISITAQQAFNQMIALCEANECQQHFPNLAENTRKLIADLRAEPLEITFENFSSGKLETMKFTAEHLTLTLRMLSYSSHGMSIVPMLLHDAYTNKNFAPLARQSALQAKKLSSTIAGGMHNSVICTEDMPFINVTDQLRFELEQTYLGTTPVEALAASCNPWPSGVMDADFKQPVVSDKPVLILSGGADPVTPPEYGEAIAKHLRNSLHIVNPGQGHMQAWLGCTPDVMNSFIERGNTKDVDYGCLERQSPQPFFIDANGPTP